MIIERETEVFGSLLLNRALEKPTRNGSSDQSMLDGVQTLHHGRLFFFGLDAQRLSREHRTTIGCRRYTMNRRSYPPATGGKRIVYGVRTAKCRDPRTVRESDVVEARVEGQKRRMKIE